jgi:hypothetical protein
MMRKNWIGRSCASPAGRRMAGIMMAGMLAASAAPARDMFVITSTNTSTNDVLVFEFSLTPTPSLSLVSMLPTGGAGGAGGNAGAVEFGATSGAVANYGSNTVTRLVRANNTIGVANTISLAPSCTGPVSVALNASHLYVVGANCAESHLWPTGAVDGMVAMSDSSAGQIAVGQTWAGVTLKSGLVVQLPLTADGALSGKSTPVVLPANANNTPLGAAFWGNILGLNPAHSPNSFALVSPNGTVAAVEGPQPAYPANAPCWLAKGAGNIWYAANSPGSAISIFFSDGQGGQFYKSIPLPGTPTDITVSRDQSWLAVIYTAADGSGGQIALYSIDDYGDLTLMATSSPIAVAAFSGVAISQ